MDELPQPLRTLRRDPQGRLAETLLCVNCGYNLRGQKPDAACAECGRPILHSLRVRCLADRDPVWLRRVGGGFACLAVACASVLTLLGLLLVFPAGAGWARLAVPWALAATLIASGIMGAWLLSRPELGAARAERWLVTRWLARIGIVLGLGGGLVCALTNDAYSDPAAAVFRQAAITGAGLLLAVGVGATFALAARFARQVPSPALARQTQLIGLAGTAAMAGWMLVMLCQLVILSLWQAGVWSPLGHVVPGTWAHTAVRFQRWVDASVEPLCRPLLAVACAWAIPVCWWCRRRFREALHAALRRAG